MAYKEVNMWVPSSKYSRKCPYSMVPSYITVHNTANDASARNEASYMRNNNNQVSFHDVVDDKEVIHCISHNRNAWHAGDVGSGTGNRKSIGIEICYSKSGGSRFTAAEKNAAAYIAKLLKQKGWGLDRVKRHKDWSGKNCPHRTMALGWTRFLNMIADEMGSAHVSGGSSSGGSVSTAGFTVGATYTIIANSGLKVRKGAGKGYAQKKRSELTADGQKNAKNQELATLKKGTRVTCQQVKVVAGDIWMKIPSGWICAVEGGVYYVSKASSGSSSSSSNKYTVGKTYTIVAKSGVKVRAGAGTNYRQKKRSELTADGKKHAKIQTYATLKKGTRVTCKAVKVVGGNVWLLIPSGWVCAVYNGNVYIS